MNEPEKAWELALEEFGDEAYKRFEIETMSKWFAKFESNEQFKRLAFFPIANIRLKPIADLVQLDIERYGDNAFLMYEYQPLINSDYESFDSNTELLDSVFELVMRKTSSALPFDLERAKKGDAIQFFNGIEWIDCVEIEQCKGTDFFNLKSLPSYINHSVKSNYLLMKYPPKLTR